MAHRARLRSGVHPATASSPKRVCSRCSTGDCWDRSLRWPDPFRRSIARTGLRDSAVEAHHVTEACRGLRAVREAGEGHVRPAHAAVLVQEVAPVFAGKLLVEARQAFFDLGGDAVRRGDGRLVAVLHAVERVGSTIAVEVASVGWVPIVDGIAMVEGTPKT